MTHNFPIQFEPRPVREAPERVRPLDIVFTPVDGFTGQVVAGISARIAAQDAKARRSLGGHLFFERLIAADSHLVSFDTGRSGYFPVPDRLIDMPQRRLSPVDVFDTPAALAAALAADTRILRLERRPEAVQDGEALVVRGGVVRDGGPAGGVVVTGLVAGNDEVFRTRTNDRGGFAIRLRPAPGTLDADSVELPRRLNVRLQFDGGFDWESAAAGGPGPLTDLRTHVIRVPIDIS